MVCDPSADGCGDCGGIESARAADRNVAATRAASGASCDTHPADGSAATLPGLSLWALCAADSLRAVSYSRGVLRVVGGGDQAWPVDDAIVADIRDRLGPEGCVEIGERPFRVGDSVRITGGPLSGWAGIFDCELSDAQ